MFFFVVVVDALLCSFRSADSFLSCVCVGEIFNAFCAMRNAATHLEHDYK